MVRNTSLCGLGQTAPNPVLSTLRFFRHEYLELLNTDSSYYGGRNDGNTGQVQTEALPAHGFPQSLNLTLPPLAALFLKPGPPPPPPHR